MDPLSLVEGGADGLVQVAEAFRTKRLNVAGIYLIKQTGHAGDERWIIRLVTEEKSPHLRRSMIVALVSLRREGALPRIDESVQFDIVHIDDPESVRVMRYAQALGGAPAVIRDVMWQGLFIEYAVVALIPERDAAAA